ncbi:hypothetical protein [Streptomyces anthocyanicus]|uniref:hypothetical protein n=1 Tax=Streptomyces anthocyanicus TaxID=68174 RepID=UPI00386B1CBB|nr:hypothetical protein OH747_05270 [Streptomyces anthocyanicus]
MARLQILELPEGSSDDRPPFVPVVDQASEDIAKALNPAESEDVSYATAIKRLTGLSIAEQIGARAVLVFEETIDIPANDTTAYLRDDVTVKLGERPIAWPQADETQARTVEATKSRRDWCCSLAFQTLGKQHIDDCKQGGPQP